LTAVGFAFDGKCSTAHDLPEILGMSDRALVMYEGRISAELSEAELTEENVILAASGLWHRPAVN
jgi:ABC-type sugar transport system ATPase subunit